MIAPDDDPNALEGMDAQWRSVETLNVNQLLRRFRCSEPDEIYWANYFGVIALNSTAVQTFHQQLLQIGLPFRVHVRGVLRSIRR